MSAANSDVMLRRVTAMVGKAPEFASGSFQATGLMNGGELEIIKVGE
jgi:hypothetical protein